MSDILLVYPRPTLDSPLKELALGIMYLGATLEDHGFDVEYHDERFDGDVTKSYKFVTSVVAVSAMTGHQLVRAEKIFKHAKIINPKITTILGGVHCTLVPKQCKSHPDIDIVIQGEGERKLLEVMQWKPITDGFIDPKDYIYPLTKKNRHYFEIAAINNQLSFPTSRGCPHKCKFCYNTVFNKNTWRPIPIEVVEDHITRLINDLPKFNHIYLLDDNIGRNKIRLTSIGRLLKSYDIKWHTSIRPEYITKELAIILDSYGCESLLIGIESGSERILKEVIGKDLPIGVKNILNCARNLSKTNISAIYSFMCNIPTETKQDLEMSMDLADWIHRTDSKGRISFYVYAPYPGTELYKTAIELGFNEPETFTDWSKITLNNSVNVLSENIYYIAGLRFRSDRTGQNFPKLQRLKILPFEILSRIRWKFRYFKYFAIEKYFIKKLLESASK